MPLSFHTSSGSGLLRKYYSTYIYSLQGCNQFGTSFSDLRCHFLMPLVHCCSLAPVTSQRGADDATATSSAVRSDKGCP